MTGGQTALSLDQEVTAGPSAGAEADAAAQKSSDLNLVVLRASEEEVAAHNALVEKFQKSV
jgi:type II secretory pathway component GspD/PulD (secretin)